MMTDPARHAVATCLTALLVLLLLHGERTATELDERGMPPQLSALLREAASMNPARLFELMNTAASRISALDRRTDAGEADDAPPADEAAAVPPLAPSHRVGDIPGRVGMAPCHERAGDGAAGDGAGAAPEKPAESAAEKAAAPADGGGEAAEAGKKKGRSIFDAPLSRRYRILLVGDSFMEDITLALMRNFHYKDPNVRYISVARHSTGLCVSTKWDWPRKLEGFMREHRPDVVVIFLGANDLQNIFDGRRRSVFMSEDWKKRYVEIARGFIDIASWGGADVIWIGMPVMGQERYAKWMPVLAGMQREACEAKRIIHVETTPFLGDAAGGFQMYAKDASGNLVRIRRDDRYHVAYAGSMMIIDRITPILKQLILKKEKGHDSRKTSEAGPRTGGDGPGNGALHPAGGVRDGA